MSRRNPGETACPGKPSRESPRLQMEKNEVENATRSCSCGSGEERWPEYDARGIFLTYACDKCRREKLSGFRPDVLSDPHYWHDEPIDPA
jgi:hypothetical protein